MKLKSLFSVLILALALFSCKKDIDPVCTDCDLSNIPYNPQPYTLVDPPSFPKMVIPADNPFTVDGIKLGRFLFYDPIMSKDSTIACASCHKIAGGFTDNEAFSKGVNGTLGTRSSMSLLNVGYYQKGLFWDGRAKSLEDQALQPIENPIEMNENWANVEKKLQASPLYRELFRKAFGIQEKKEITKFLAAKAISQFERTLLSYNSPYDLQILAGNPVLDDDILDGYTMFFNGSPSLPDAQCGHCHDGVLLTNNGYFNNGLDSFPNLEDFPDAGLGGISKIPTDNGKFRAPTLRNIRQTAPYMHDGRFKTVEEVMDHYTDHIKKMTNLDANLYKVKLTEKQKQQVLKFITTLEDTTYIHNPAYQNPFK